MFLDSRTEVLTYARGTGHGWPSKGGGGPTQFTFYTGLDASLRVLLRLWDAWFPLLPLRVGSWASNRTQMLNKWHLELLLPRNPVSPAPYLYPHSVPLPTCLPTWSRNDGSDRASRKTLPRDPSNFANLSRPLPWVVVGAAV